MVTMSDNQPVDPTDSAKARQEIWDEIVKASKIDGSAQPPDISTISEDNDPSPRRFEDPPYEEPDAIEQLVRQRFEQFLDFRRQALRLGNIDSDAPPGSMDRLTGAGLAVLKQVIEDGADWLFMACQFQTSTKAASLTVAPALQVEGAIERTYLASMIFGGGIVPPELQRGLSLALNALNHGEVQPLVAPALLGRWRAPYSLAQLRLDALIHLHLRWGRGLAKKVAKQQIADAFGISIGTIRKWEESWVPGVMGRIDSMLRLAWEAGRLAKRYPEGLPDEYSMPRWFLAWIEQERPLAALAEEHRQLMRETVPKRRTRKKVLPTAPK